MKFLTHRVSTKSTGLFSQKSFSRHFWQPSWISALNAKTCLSQKRSKIEGFLWNFLPAGYLRSLLVTFCKNGFSRHFWRPSWISPLRETERHRAISTKFFFNPLGIWRLYWRNAFISGSGARYKQFFTCRVSAESPADFSPKSFSCHFWQPFWISALNTKTRLS